ncbi:carboxylesterase family protein [Ekhidna sp.]
MNAGVIKNCHIKYRSEIARIILLLLLIGHFSETLAQCDTPLFDASEVVIQKNIIYGEAENYEGSSQSLLLDLYYPSLMVDQSEARPLVVIMHGGWFKFGNKNHKDIKILCQELAARGYVCSSINYRLGHNNSEYSIYQARYRAIQDANAAIRFLISKSGRYNIDRNWIFIGGQSAGAVVANGVVYADEEECDDISESFNKPLISKELGALNESGNDLRPSFNIKGVFNNWGGVLENEFQTSEYVPTISFHGVLDTEVAYGVDSTYSNFSLLGSQIINRRLKNVNVCTELMTDLNGGHGIFRDESSSYRAQRASCFFKSIMCNTCQSLFSTDSIAASCSVIDYDILRNDNLSISASPNPSQNYFRLLGVNEPVRVKIYNSSGRIIANLASPDQIDLSNHPNGLYVVKLIFTTSTRKPEEIKIIKK